MSYDDFIDKVQLIREIGQIAKALGFDGDLYDDQQRIRRNHTSEEGFAYHEVFRAIGEKYVLVSECRRFVKRLVWNAIMNSTEFKQHLGE